MKAVIVGGGSTYTPELIEGMVARQAELGLSEVVLEDIDPGRLEPVLEFCRRMADHAGASFLLRGTTDLEDAVTGAAFVVVQIRVGGQEARHRDEMLGLRHGLVGQETTGCGGFAKALRTLPAIHDIADTIRDRAPSAWVVNFTNPSGMVTESLLRFGGVRAVGLCNIPIEMKMEVARALGVPPETVELDYAGLNHLGWVRRIRVQGTDVTDKIVGRFAGGRVPKNIPEIDFGADFFDALRMIPSPYLRYFYATEEVVAELQAAPKTRAEVVMDLERRLFAYYRDPTTCQKPALLAERGGAWYSRVAIDVIAGLQSDAVRREVVNTQSLGAFPGLPDDAVAEFPCELSRAGVRPLPVDPLEEEILGLVRQVKSYERLTIEAARTRSKGKALLALMANPLVRTLGKARAVLADLVASGDFVPADD